ncbi:MAG: hypothetical protein RLZZ87_580 [Actinomycetota bacterium]|jgi:hypothetical protein
MSKLICAECNSRIRTGANFCSSCGNAIEWASKTKTSSSKVSPFVYTAYLLIIALVAAPIYGIYSQRDADLFTKLRNQGVLSWTEDSVSEGVVSAGQYAPEQAITTATGSCSLWLYEDEVSANAALDNYINDNIDFSAAWTGEEKATGQGAVLLTLEANSFCSEEAGNFLHWELE